MDAEKQVEIEYALRGKAWKVYWYLLKKGGQVSVREVQKALKFSSSSVANHHLEQLRELGLVKKQDVGGYYSLVAEVKIGILRHYVKLGKVLFPRFLFYAIFFTTFYGAFLLFMVSRFSRENFFIALFGALVCIVLWYETQRFWSLRPY
ncbi:MAG: winged helix-turn-helix domain-containing protein [Candidatus Bathyarchaeota archaeon]|nr:winged helix-turn-helix domain-containing protein [Candidatus Bathyarchaeota archaeon]